MTLSNSMQRILSTLVTCATIVATLHAGEALAERADRDKPLRIRADASTGDDKSKTRVLEGRVKITQGSLVITADKVVITLDADGYERAVATGGEGGLSHLQQKREGRDEMVYADGERIEYDSKTEKAKLFRRAWIRMGKGDEACADYIEYDGITEKYSAMRPAGSKPDDQIEIVIPGKGQPASTVMTDTCERKKK